MWKLGLWPSNSFSGNIGSLQCVCLNSDGKKPENNHTHIYRKVLKVPKRGNFDVILFMTGKEIFLCFGLIFAI
jgi:hypothetical protein